MLDSEHEQPKDNVYLDQSKNLVLSSQSDLKVGLENLPAPLKVEIENIQIAEPIKEVVTKPLLKSNVGNQLRNLRKNYVAHSQNPKDLERNLKMFILLKIIIKLMLFQILIVRMENFLSLILTSIF